MSEQQDLDKLCSALNIVNDLLQKYKLRGIDWPKYRDRLRFDCGCDIKPLTACRFDENPAPSKEIPVQVICYPHEIGITPATRIVVLIGVCEKCGQHYACFDKKAFRSLRSLVIGLGERIQQ